MNDLISRKAAIDKAERECKQDGAYGYMDIKSIVDMLEDLPSVDAVEVVRCKDCVYQTESWIGIKYCEAHGDHIGEDYDYCSNARKKDNG